MSVIWAGFRHSTGSTANKHFTLIDGRGMEMGRGRGAAKAHVAPQCQISDQLHRSKSRQLTKRPHCRVLQEGGEGEG